MFAAAVSPPGVLDHGRSGVQQGALSAAGSPDARQDLTGPISREARHQAHCDRARRKQMFDGLVDSGTRARGTLNGKPIEVVETRLISTPHPAPSPGAGLFGGSEGSTRGAGGAASRGGSPSPLPGPRATVEPPPATRMEPPTRLGGPMGGGPLPPESTPHPVQPPHSHHELPVLGKDELPDLDEFNPG